MDALIIISPPAGAAKSSRWVSTRPEVQAPLLSSAVRSRWPLPSRCTLLVEFVIVSTSPSPHWAAPVADVVPVLVIQFADDGADPDRRAMLSFHTGVEFGEGWPVLPLR